MPEMAATQRSSTVEREDRALAAGARRQKRSMLCATVHVVGEDIHQTL